MCPFAEVSNHRLIENQPKDYENLVGMNHARQPYRTPHNGNRIHLVELYTAQSDFLQHTLDTE